MAFTELPTTNLSLGVFNKTSHNNPLKNKADTSDAPPNVNPIYICIYSY